MVCFFFILLLLWFGYFSFVSLVAYALHFDDHLFLCYYYLWFTSQELWIFDVAKGGEKWGV